MAGDGNARPLCQVSNPIVIDQGTLTRQCSPRPVPICTALPTGRQRLSIETLVFEEDQATAFLESVAHAKVAERHIKLVWKDYKKSKLLNTIYSIPGLGRPGFVEVDPRDVQTILSETSEETKKLQEEFCIALSRGPSRLLRWLGAQEDIRKKCSETVQLAYQEAGELNEAMQAETRRAVARLTLIKASATITLKTTALVGGGWPAFLIGSGYDISLDLIKNWDRAAEAKLIGMVHKAEDKTWKKIVKDGAKNMADIYKGEEETPSKKAEWLRKRLAQMEGDIEKRATEQWLAKFAKDSRRLARAEQAAFRARWAAGALSTVNYGFFAWDMVNGWKDTSWSVHEAGYESFGSALQDVVG